MVKGRQDNKHQEGVTLIMGITEARWTGAGKQRLNSGETIIWLGRQDNKHQEGVTLIMGITEAR